MLPFSSRSLVVRSALFVLVIGGCTDETAIGPDQPAPEATARWSDPDTWPDGRVPAAGDSVVIPGDLGVLLDVSPPELHSITIEGTLEFDEVDLSVTAKWILVRGLLQIGTEDERYDHRAVITLTGRPEDGDVMGMGNRVLGVAPTGTLEIHGTPRVSWTRLAATVEAGGTDLVLEHSVDWNAGDEIVVASSDFDPLHAEQRRIVSANGETVALNEPLDYQHYGVTQTIEGIVVDQRAEVGLLSRNIVVRGSTDTTGGIGGHIRVEAGGEARVEGVELHLVGQHRTLGRYPMHWHLVGDGEGQYFINNSIWKTFNRCVTVHGTDNARVEDNVCYDHRGHGYFLEDGAETGNVITGNLGLVTRAPAADEALLPSDTRASTFWITNPDNIVSRNVAAGSRGFGFWYALPETPTGLSAGESDLPRRTPLREFNDNVAHSNRRAGLNVDHGPTPSGETETTSYRPRQDPAADSPPVIAVFRNFTAYKHRGRAVWLRGRDHRLIGAVLADNGIGATFASSETVVEDALFVGESANNASALSSSVPYRGYEFYDGTVGARRVTFVNYTRSASIPSSALGFNRNNGFALSPRNFAEDLSFVNANPVYIEDPHADKDGDKAAVFFDATGSVTGTPGRYVVANNPILVTAACGFRAEWNAFECPHRYFRLQLRSEGGEDIAPVTVTRDDGAMTELVGVPNRPDRALLSLLPARDYRIDFAGTAPPTTRLSLTGTEEGEWARITLPYPNVGFEVVRDYNNSNPLPAAANLAELEASDGGVYFYDAATGLLHLKAVTREGRDYANLLIRPN